jgi:hypothetical protein
LSVRECWGGGGNVLVSVATLLQLLAFAIQCTYYRDVKTDAEPEPKTAADPEAAPAPAPLTPIAESKDEEAQAEREDEKKDALGPQSGRPVSFLPRYSAVVTEADAKKVQEDLKAGDRKSAILSAV